MFRLTENESYLPPTQPTKKTNYTMSHVVTHGCTLNKYVNTYKYTKCIPEIEKFTNLCIISSMLGSINGSPPSVGFFLLLGRLFASI